MKIYNYLFTFLLTIFVFPANAFTPESGWWWNPQESGRGLVIEIQDDVLALSAYVYSEDGFPEWYSSAGPLIGNSLYQGELNYYDGGQCIACDYIAPFVTPGLGGDITIEFHTQTTATLTWAGGSIPIERFNFALGDINQKMLGEWQIVVDFSALNGYPFSADVLIFDQITNDNSGTIFEGCRTDNTIDGSCSSFALTNHAAAGSFDFDNGEHVIVVDDSDDFWIAYYLTVNTNQFQGVIEVYEKTLGQNNIYYPVRGFRTASASFVQSGVGPSKALLTNKTNSGIITKELYNQMLASQQNTPNTSIKALSNNMHKLQQIRDQLIERLKLKESN